MGVSPINRPLTGSERLRTKMLAKDLMTSAVICCTAWNTAQMAASLMKAQGVGAILVVADPLDPLLEGIVTDRDLCCDVVAVGKEADVVQIADLMTAIPVTCTAEDTIGECEALMQEGQIRRIPIVNNRGRYIGIMAQADIALHAPAAQLAKTIKEISESAKPHQEMHFEKGYFYCGQPHEQDQIVLLNRQRELSQKHEVLIGSLQIGQKLARNWRCV